MKNLTNRIIGDGVASLNSTQFVFFGAEQMNTLNDNVDGGSSDEEMTYEELLAKYKEANKKLEKIKEDEKADRKNEELVDTDEVYEKNIVMIGGIEYDVRKL